MKNYALFLAVNLVLTLGAVKNCSSQTPQWVSDLAHETLVVDIASITHWEEKQMTWYNVNGQLDQSDSIRVHTLLVKGTTVAGYNFVGAVPVANGAVAPVGTKLITGQSCSGECGCQRCEFKSNTYGCDCKDSVEQPNCSAWCKHSITDRKR